MSRYATPTPLNLKALKVNRTRFYEGMPVEQVHCNIDVRPFWVTVTVPYGGYRSAPVQ